MSVRVSGGGFKGLSDELEKLMQRVTGESSRQVKGLAAEGAEQVREFVSTRGTARSGKAGRIETGAMLNSVGSRVLEDGLTSTKAEYGFINSDPAYTGYQEYSFQHYRSGEQIEGMFALRDAAEITATELADIGRRTL